MKQPLDEIVKCRVQLALLDEHKRDPVVVIPPRQSAYELCSLPQDVIALLLALLLKVYADLE